MDIGGFAAERRALDWMRSRFASAKTAEMFFCTDFLLVVDMLKKTFCKYSDPCSTGWRLFIGVDPIPRLDSGAKQRREKVGRWAA
jgi:hypothetical protein